MIDDNLKKLNELQNKIDVELKEVVLLDEKLDSINYKIKSCCDDYELAELYDVREEIKKEIRIKNNRILIYKITEKILIAKVGSVEYENDSNYQS